MIKNDDMQLVGLEYQLEHMFLILIQQHVMYVVDTWVKQLLRFSRWENWQKNIECELNLK